MTLTPLRRSLTTGFGLRERAHTREADAIAAARRRLPMTEVAPVDAVDAARFAAAVERARTAPTGPRHCH